MRLALVLGAAVVLVGCGSSGVPAVRGAGVLTCWGSNDVGQLGDGTVASEAMPVTVPGEWTAVNVTVRRTCALDGDGNESCWGELADGVHVTPVAATVDISAWADASAAADHSCRIAVGE